MIEFYAEIKFVHIAAIIASGSLFALRGLALLTGGAWAMATPVRVLSYGIDTVLLTAALMLMTVVQQYPFADGWLTAKVLLLMVYVVLGVLALRANTRPAARLGFYVAAVAIYLFIASIALARHPLGIFVDLFGA